MIFHLSWIYWYKNVNPDSSVLCFALRSGQTEWYSIWDSPLELELRLEIQLSIDSAISYSVDSSDVFWSCIWLLYWDIYVFVISVVSCLTLLYLYSSFMNYYSFVSVALLLYYSMSVICDYFIYCICWVFPKTRALIPTVTTRYFQPFASIISV